MSAVLAMNQTYQIRQRTPVHTVHVRGYGNLCPSDCGNRSLTGHADSAVYNKQQVPSVHTLQSQTIVLVMLMLNIKCAVLCRIMQGANLKLLWIHVFFVHVWMCTARL